jgi:hypothetical protein
MGPSKFIPERDQAKLDEICELLRMGTVLTAICRAPGMPARRTVYDWLAGSTEAAAQFAQARDIGFDAIADDTVAIVDEKPERGRLDGKVDAGFVQWQKLRVEQRLKLLSKWSPKRYGELLKVEATVDGDLAAAIALGRKRSGG